MTTPALPAISLPTPTGSGGGDDAALWRRLRAGDQEALGQLYRELGGRLLRFGERFTASRALGEDVLQDVFLSLIDELASGATRFDPGRGSLRSYLFGVARHAGLRRLRAQPRPAGAGTSEVGSRRDDEEHAVRTALCRLESPFREVVLLCDLEGLSYEEAAAALEVPVGTIRSRLARARARLAAALDDRTQPSVARKEAR